MKSALLAITAVVLLLPARQEPEPSGPHELDTIDFPDLTDAARSDRPVPIKIHVPKGDGRHPVVVFSHGGGGTRDANLYQAQDLASHGYAVLCVEHVRSNNAAMKEHIRAAKGTLAERVQIALQKIVSDPEAVLQRPRDVTFAIDRAVEWDRDHKTLQGRLDTSKVAVAGHSFGAYSTMVACGAQPTLEHLDPPVEPRKGLAGDLSDPRVTCGIAMSPQGLGTSRFSKESFATLNRPLLCLSGTLDTQFGHDGKLQPAEVRLEGFRMFPEGGKYMAWLENTDHLAFSDNPDAFKLPSRARDDAQRIAKDLTLAFCNFYLKGDPAAKKRLSAEHAATLTGRVVTKVTWYER